MVGNAPLRLTVYHQRALNHAWRNVPEWSWCRLILALWLMCGKWVYKTATTSMSLYHTINRGIHILMRIFHLIYLNEYIMEYSKRTVPPQNTLSTVSEFLKSHQIYLEPKITNIVRFGGLYKLFRHLLSLDSQSGSRKNLQVSKKKPEGEP